LFNKIEKSLKALRSNSQYENTLILFDNLNILMNGCYQRNELDIIEIFNEALGFCNDPNVSLALSINRDLFANEGDEDLTLEFYRD
jgi:hypothetical protein